MLYFARRVRGVAMAYLIIMIAAIIGFVSLGADWGRVQVAKTELRRAADAAARYAAASLGSGTNIARTNAILAAADNLCDGTTVMLLSEDIEFGVWDESARTFTVLSGAAQSGADTVRVTARRTAARSTAVPTIWAALLGCGTCDITASSTAQYNPGGVRGFVGLTGASFGSNLWLASYKSALMTTPTHSNFNPHGGVGSNGTLRGRVNDEVYGTMFLGPAGDDSGMAVHGKMIVLDNPISFPDMPAWVPTDNPGGVPANYTVNSNTVLPGGDYWFTSLTISDSLTFTGPATLHVNGDVQVSGSLIAYDSRPPNLTIYQYGSNNFTDGNKNNMILTAKVIAPEATFDVKNSTIFCGEGFFKVFNAGNYCDFYYDESLGVAGISSDFWVNMVK